MKQKGSYRIKLVFVAIAVAIAFFSKHVEADFSFGEPVNLEAVIPLIDPAQEDIVSLSSDGLEIYIESLRPGGEGDLDIWVLRRNSLEEDWSPPENLGPTVNSPELESGASISADGLTLLFTSDRPGGHGLEDIYVTTRSTTNSPWGQAVNMGPGPNSSSYDNYPCMSTDGLELYFSSMRPGGFGLADLWFTRRATASDAWGEPANLGPVINSAHADMDPHLSSDGQILLFSGHRDESSHLPGGYGGADIWMMRRQTLSAPWQAPVNLGPKVNNSKHGFIPRISPDGSTLYLVTESGGTWENWLAPIIPVVDFNSDGTVDSADVCTMIDHWGTDNSSCDIGPMPWGDGIVDTEDLKVLAEFLFGDTRCVAHFKLDEVEGITANDSARDRDGSVYGNPQWQPTGGVVGGALQLDGVDDYVRTGSVLNPADGELSVFAWIKGGTPGQVVLSQAGASDWLCTDSVEGYLITELKPTGRGGVDMTSQTLITDGDWHRIGLVWDGSCRYLYVDGIEVAQAVAGLSSLEGAYGSLYLGAGSTLANGTFFSGLIDDVRIYKRVVSP